jgi:RNA polymerase sigma factor (sigma-70 family)
MEQQTTEVVNILVSPEERMQLVHFCTTITNNRDVAEDLAQDTLLEAWRNTHLLRNIEKRKAWLFGIARNMCLRWLRDSKRDSAHLLSRHPGQESFQTEIEDVLADDLDIELELEHKELIELLDRALSLLPAATRTVLIQHYVEASPLAEIAAELGSNASAVSMRLQRGKLVLRHALAKEIGQSMPLFATSASNAEWETTPLWCHNCGERRLLGQRDSHESKLLLKCPACNPGPDDIFNKISLPILKGVKGYKPLYSRLAAWCDRYYHTGLRDGSITCERCLSSCITMLESLVLESADGQQFLQKYPRIRTLPRQYIETGGRATVLTSSESVTSTARWEFASSKVTRSFSHLSL